MKTSVKRIGISEWVGTTHLCPPRLAAGRTRTRAAVLLTLVMCLMTVAISHGQTIPTVSILPSQATVHEGETFLAHVFISDATHIGGADVGIHVDDQCLRITERSTGTFLPDADGGFTAFSAQDDHSTRLALAITDRERLGNGSGAFFEVELLVTCASGTASLEVTFSELSAYKDPLAEEVELESYTMTAGNLHIVNAQVEIVPLDEQTQLPVTAIAPVEASTQPAAETTLPATATLTDETLPASDTTAESNTLNVTIFVVLSCLSLLIVVVILWLARRFLRDRSE